MAVLGKGTANGGCSLLHAAGLGYGATVTLDLPVTVKLLDRESKKGPPNDPDQLLNAVLNAWTTAGYTLPEGLESRDLHWRVDSKIPSRQGLKSSSAVAVAALRAIADAVEQQLDDAAVVELAVESQIHAGVTITGSVGDTWAAATSGWKLVDPQQPIRDGVLLQGEVPGGEDWDVAIVLRGERKQRPNLEQFAPHATAFQQALKALQEGNLLMAMTWNGRGVAAALSDIDGRKLANDAFMNTARAAGITGSGPAVAILVPKNQPQAMKRIERWITSRYQGSEILMTGFLKPAEEQR
ncbi:MAG: hypothetical protein DWC07_02390 [Candidatus Poseidoniales archaeon]|nr:MAG: hypothetical protein DWC07_02390 [Candidatus Poseidoniales archaeon]